jgi:hypothetical protein
VTPRGLVTAYEYFERLFCLHLQVQNKCREDMISVYGQTARTVVTQIGGREGAEEIRLEPAAGVSRQYESSRGQTEFLPQLLLP